MDNYTNPIEAIRQDIAESKHIYGSLKVLSANDVITKAKREPDPVNLYDGIIFGNTMVAIFSDTGLGKSTYAVQIGEAIALTQPVLLLDCELSDKQFELRYRSAECKHHCFPTNFYRVTINSENILNEKQIFEDIKAAAIGCGCKVLIIDNLTYLCNNSEKGDIASNFMKQLKTLKDDGYTIIVLAHTPKLSPFRAISDCDMAGSRRLANFFDTMIAIGRSSQDPQWRYIKQVKGNRTAENKYDSDNVLVCKLTMQDDALRMVKLCTDRERNHLKVLSPEEEEHMEENIMILKNQGYSYREIAAEVGVSKSTVARIINEEHV